MPDDGNPNPPTDTVTVESLQAQIASLTADRDNLTTDRDKWKGLSRKHEGERNDALKQVSTLESETASAVDAAREEGRQAALADTAHTRVEAALYRQAAASGVQLPDSIAAVVDLGRLAADDGTPDTDAIAGLLAAFTPRPDAPKYAPPDSLGIGQRQPSTDQLTRADLQTLTPAEINQARLDGRLDNLLNGET
ncbi:hypothetical protein SAMN05421505_112127 [Sinosporangium album]|uniref:Phage minor structural protein GP20 n=1 Tax=Sinosporangium album TaxID=504805 RepID=A0A1G8AF58_9ACTN|nr:hypothetical protein [Sinosporangium album]SDH19507.1 hypothetical protein SAMN05421505_112127 [Sinosporangium album]